MRIREIRQEKGMTQQELADRSHITRESICRYECGKRVPDLKNLIRIRCALECTLDELVGPEYIASESAS